jgi:hypothetical protein
MTQDEIIEMARQAGGVPAGDGCLIAGTVNLRKFAKLVAAKEREACAKVCDGLASDWYEKHHPLECARKIRARACN